MKSARDKITEGINEVLASQTDEVRDVDAKVINSLGEFGAFTLGNAIGRLVREHGAEEVDRMLAVYVSFIHSKLVS